MTLTNFNHIKDTKILKVRFLPSKRISNIGFIIQGQFLHDLGYEEGDQVKLTTDKNNNIHISKI